MQWDRFATLRLWCCPLQTSSRAYSIARRCRHVLHCQDCDVKDETSISAFGAIITESDLFLPNKF
eukprot:4771339-Amphidinium_carterae.1